MRRLPRGSKASCPMACHGPAWGRSWRIVWRLAGSATPGSDAEARTRITLLLAGIDRSGFDGSGSRTNPRYTHPVAWNRGSRAMPSSPRSPSSFTSALRSMNVVVRWPSHTLTTPPRSAMKTRPSGAWANPVGPLNPPTRVRTWKPSGGAADACGTPMERSAMATRSARSAGQATADPIRSRRARSAVPPNMRAPPASAARSGPVGCRRPRESRPISK